MAITGTISGSANALTRSDFSVVSTYIEDRDATGLRNYIASNSAMLDGSQLSRELTAYLQTPPREGLLVTLGLTSPFPRTLLAAVEATKRDNSIY